MEEYYTIKVNIPESHEEYHWQQDCIFTTTIYGQTEAFEVAKLISERFDDYHVEVMFFDGYTSSLIHPNQYKDKNGNI